MSDRLLPSGPVSVELSIIVPVFNAQAYLTDCVESILRQDFSDFELLLVDDGSTDGSAGIAECLATGDVRIRVFHLENGGPSSARNFGLLQARGRYVQFVDADDLLEPDCCQVFHEMMKNGSPDLAICGARVLGQNMAEIATIEVPANGIHGTVELLGSLTPATKATLLHYVWNKWYRLSLIREKNLRFHTDVRLGEDFLFNCDYWRHSLTIGLVQQPLYQYCKRSASSLTGQFRPDELSRRRKMDQELAMLYEHFGLLNESRPMLDRCIAAIALDSIASVAHPECALSRGERLRFIEEFVDSEYYDLIREYGAWEGLSFLSKLKCRMVQHRAAGGLYFLLRISARAKLLLPGR